MTISSAFRAKHAPLKESVMHGLVNRFVEEFLRGAPAHLAPGGIAQLLGNWETAAGQDWRERVGEWVAASGLDAWVVQRDRACA